MILFDRFCRWLKNDIYLPKNCNNNKNIFKIKECCKCKIYCKHPKPGKPIYLKINEYNGKSIYTK